MSAVHALSYTLRDWPFVQPQLFNSRLREGGPSGLRAGLVAV